MHGLFEILRAFISGEKANAIPVWRNRAYCFLVNIAELLPLVSPSISSQAKDYFFKLMNVMYEGVSSDRQFSEIEQKTSLLGKEKGALDIEKALFAPGPGHISPFCALCEWQCHYYEMVARIFKPDSDLYRYACDACSGAVGSEKPDQVLQNIINHFKKRLGYRDATKMMPFLICFLSQVDADCMMPDSTLKSFMERLRTDAGS
jgi:hypothetical protein